MRDALLGTREYQNHLRAAGSRLYIEKHAKGQESPLK